MISRKKAEQNARIFFLARFGKEKLEYSQKHGYFEEWVKRFQNGEPELFMDSESLRIFGELIDRGEISWLVNVKMH